MVNGQADLALKSIEEALFLARKDRTEGKVLVDPRVVSLLVSGLVKFVVSSTDPNPKLEEGLKSWINTIIRPGSEEDVRAASLAEAAARTVAASQPPGTPLPPVRVSLCGNPSCSSDDSDLVPSQLHVILNWMFRKLRLSNDARAASPCFIALRNARLHTGLHTSHTVRPRSSSLRLINSVSIMLSITNRSRHCTSKYHPDLCRTLRLLLRTVIVVHWCSDLLTWLSCDSFVTHLACLTRPHRSFPSRPCKYSLNRSSRQT